MKKIFVFLTILLSIVTQSQTVVETQNLINSNLATGTKITAEKHREVEISLLNLIQKSLPLAKGVRVIGDIATTDMSYYITFPDIGTSNYYVVGSFMSKSFNHANDNDLTWAYRGVTSTSFIISVREVSANTQNVDFYWELRPL